MGISSVTLAELEDSVAKSSRPEKNREALSGFLAPLEIAPFDDFAAAHYGEIRANLAKAGLPIGAMDLLIASHARSLDVVLVTNNLKEFQLFGYYRIGCSVWSGIYRLDIGRADITSRQLTEIFHFRYDLIAFFAKKYP